MFYNNKVVLVTGGTGFIGAHIVEELLKQGAKVRIPVHKRPMPVENKNIEVVDANLADKRDCMVAAEGVDYVFHAAGYVGAAGVTSGQVILESIAGNFMLLSNMLGAAWEKGVERFLLFSSSTVYPDFRHPVKEEEAWADAVHPSYFGYGWSKRYIERFAEFVASKSDMKISIVRPTAVYGRLDNFDLKSCHVIPALIRKAIERQDPYEVWGSGEEVRDFVHVGDLARGSLLMLEKYAKADPVNIGYGKSATIKEVVEIILKAADYKDASLIFDTSKPSTIPFRAVDTSKAKRVLGFEPIVSLEEGLRDTVKWYKERAI
ncbi:MAG: NAD-dependent epimerase/dehydratase family protein [Candidatus Omnitrophica bacterium]|nr:NAD-dependent epimerase/dehydratase family protein [Candidatus Omnitrophota bacterium]